MHFIRGEYLSGILKKIFLIQNMRNTTHPFFHDASILVSVGVFLTHRFETVGVFAHFLCVKNAKTPSIWSSALFDLILKVGHSDLYLIDFQEMALARGIRAPLSTCSSFCTFGPPFTAYESILEISLQFSKLLSLCEL